MTSHTVTKSKGEISLLTSMMGLEAKTLSSTLVCWAAPPTTAKYLMVNLAETVFPDPDSPLMMIDWFFSSLPTYLYISYTLISAGLSLLVTEYMKR